MFRIIVALVTMAGMIPLALGGKYNMLKFPDVFLTKSSITSIFTSLHHFPSSIEHQGPMIPCNTTTWNNFRTTRARLLLLLPSPFWLLTSAFPKTCNRLRLHPLELDLILPNTPKQHLHREQLPRMVPWRWLLIQIKIAIIKMLVALPLPFPFLPLKRAQKTNMARMEPCLPAPTHFLVLLRRPSSTKVAFILSTTNWRWRPWWVISPKAPRVPSTQRLLILIAPPRTPMILPETNCPFMRNGQPMVLAHTVCWPKLTRKKRVNRSQMLAAPVPSPTLGKALVIQLARLL